MPGGSPRRYEAARGEVQGPATTTDARSLILEQATISHDGRARWAEEGHAIVGDGQAFDGARVVRLRA
jgi:hypothetical protein